MAIVNGVDDRLQRDLEVIFSLESTGLYLCLESIETGQDIDAGLLIARGRILEVCKCALCLEKVFVICHQTGGNSCVERCRDQAIIGIVS